jgi:hypothetical protein
MTPKLVFRACVLTPFLLGAPTIVVDATTLTPGEKQLCKNVDISLSECAKVVQERHAKEAADQLALSKIIPKTANYVVQIITGDQTSWSGYVGPGLTEVAGTGSQSYTVVCTTRPISTFGLSDFKPAGYYATAKITSSADNPPSLTLNLLYNGQIVNSTTVNQDFVDATIQNSGCPSK